MLLVDYAASSSDEDEPHSPPPQRVLEEEERLRFGPRLPSSSPPDENPTLQIHAPSPQSRNLTNPSEQVEKVPNQSSELKLPDASTLFDSPAVPSSLLNALDHSSRVAVAMAESTARKRELNGSSAGYPRSSKVPKGAVPHTKNVPDTVGGKLLPPQLAGRSNVVTEDITKLFVRKPANSSTE